MGSTGGVPRSGMQTTAWGIAYLGWNAKWVVGYRGTQDLFIALQRARKISQDIAPQSGADVKRLIDTLGSIPAPAIEQISVMLQQQGLTTK